MMHLNPHPERNLLSAEDPRDVYYRAFGYAQSRAVRALCEFTSCDLGNIGNSTSNGNGFTDSIRVVPLVREYGVDYPVIVQRIFDP